MTSVKKKRRRAVVVRGVMAQVDGEKCVGCGKCARECPASVIEIQEVEV